VVVDGGYAWPGGGRGEADAARPARPDGAGPEAAVTPGALLNRGGSRTAAARPAAPRSVGPRGRGPSATGPTPGARPARAGGGPRGAGRSAGPGGVGSQRSKAEGLTRTGMRSWTGRTTALASVVSRAHVSRGGPPGPPRSPTAPPGRKWLVRPAACPPAASPG